MKTQNIEVELRDGTMGAYLAIPDRTPAGAIIAIMEIWGVNDTMRHHAHEFAEAGFTCSGDKNLASSSPTRTRNM
jgi:carboxymethylenebutenolidase